VAFVLDASVTVSSYLTDEDSEFADKVMARLDADRAIVPSLWPTEVANALLVAERRRRITPAELDEAIGVLVTLPVFVRPKPFYWTVTKVLDLARAQALNAYDAAYLDLAMTEGLPLATQDSDLRAAAVRVGVDLVE